MGDVSALLSLDDGQAWPAARRIGAHKLADIRQRRHGLRPLEIALKTWVDHGGVTKGRVKCPLIEVLAVDWI